MNVFLEIPLPSTSPDFGGLLGYRIAIGSMFVLHILISGAVSGATQLGPFLQWVGWMRRRPRTMPPMPWPLRSAMFTG